MPCCRSEDQVVAIVKWWVREQAGVGDGGYGDSVIMCTNRGGRQRLATARGPARGRKIQGPPPPPHHTTPHHIVIEGRWGRCREALWLHGRKPPEEQFGARCRQRDATIDGSDVYVSMQEEEEE